MNNFKWRYLLLPGIYLLVGGITTSMLVQRILYYADVLWLVMLLPMVMIAVLLFVVGMANVWLNYRASSEEGLLQQYGQRRLTWLYLRCWAVMICGLTLGVVFAWMYQLLPNYLQELFGAFRVLYYVICAILTIIALMSIVLGENLQEIRLRNAQSENQLLKAQLNPHFLYNTLNNIDALIWLDQERASAAVTGLSSLMRYMTYSARQELVPLADEVSAIRQLCQLQRLRMSSAEALQLSLPTEGLDGISIAPLLLIPLVENCFKHGGATNEPNAVCIRLEVSSKESSEGNQCTIVFTTDNNLKDTLLTSHTPDSLPSREGRGGSPGRGGSSGRGGSVGNSFSATTSSSSGVGLTVLRRRLELLYPHQYTFTAQREGDRFRTRLTVAG